MFKNLFYEFFFRTSKIAIEQSTFRLRHKLYTLYIQIKRNQLFSPFIVARVYKLLYSPGEVYSSQRTWPGSDRVSLKLVGFYSSYRHLPPSSLTKSIVREFWQDALPSSPRGFICDQCFQ